jgi:hypothetical protein
MLIIIIINDVYFFWGFLVLLVLVGNSVFCDVLLFGVFVNSLIFCLFNFFVVCFGVCFLVIIYFWALVNLYRVGFIDFGVYSFWVILKTLCFDLFWFNSFIIYFICIVY